MAIKDDCTRLIGVHTFADGKERPYDETMAQLP